MEQSDYSKFGKLINLDDIHFSTRTVDGFDKPFNFIVGCRDSGKTTDILNKIYRLFIKKGSPSLILRRRTVDITIAYLESIAASLNLFLDQEHQIGIYFNKTSIKDGVVDGKIYLLKEYEERKFKNHDDDLLFIRIVSLSAPMSRIKSTLLPNIGIIFFDEFICNTRLGEKYLNGESFIFKEIYTTYQRGCTGILRCYFAGNPYSLYSPLLATFKIPVQRIYPGALFSGSNYVFCAYKICEKLANKLLAKNPLYEVDKEYADYAFNGVAINDANIRIERTQPQYFDLRWVFRVRDKYVGIYGMGRDCPYGIDRNRIFWCKLLDNWNESYKRNAICWELNQLVNGTVKVNSQDKQRFSWFSSCIDYREVTFSDIETYYLIEEVYQYIHI